MTKNEVLNQLQEFSYELYKAGMRQAAGDYAYLVAWIKSEDWDNPLKEGKLRLPPEPLGVNTIDAYSHNCPIPYELIVPIDDYCRTIIDNIIELLESLQDFIDDDDTASNIIENYIIASGKTEYTYTTVELKSDLLGSDVVLAPGSYEFFNYYYNDTEYQIIGQLLDSRGNLNAAIVKAVDSEDNDINVRSLSLAMNDNKLSVANIGSENVTISKLYLVYSDWCYGNITADASIHTSMMSSLRSGNFNAVYYVLTNTRFDSALWKVYANLMNQNEIDCEECQSYIWGERPGLKLSFAEDYVRVHNTTDHDIAPIHGVRWVNWFPETSSIKSKIKASLTNDDFDFKCVAYLDTSKDKTDIPTDGIFIYDNYGNKIPYDITKTYTITNVYAGSFRDNSSDIKLFYNDGFIGIKKTNPLTDHNAIHIKYSIADKVRGSCANCGSILDLYDICHNTDCELSPDYIPKCPNCLFDLDNAGICHNEDCEVSPDYIPKCPDCNSVLDDNSICHNTLCVSSPDYIEPPEPDFEHTELSVSFGSRRSPNTTLAPNATTQLNGGEYYSIRQSFKIDKVYEGTDGANLLENHTLALGEQSSSYKENSIIIRNVGSDSISFSKIDYLKYNNTCLVTCSNSTWGLFPITIRPNESVTVYSTERYQQIWRTSLYETDEYIGYELAKVVLINSMGERRLHFNNKLILTNYNGYSNITNVSNEPIKFNYAVVKLIPRPIEYCDECGFELDRSGICHNTDCVISSDYIVPHVLELDLYLRALSKNPVETHFGENDHWYSIIKSNSDLTKLTLFGHEASTSNDQLDIGFGCIKWNSDEFNYEFVGIYDSDGNSVVDYGNTSDNVYLDYNSNYNVLSIYTRDIAINSFCYTWRIRISKKPVITLYASATGDSNELISEVKHSMYKSDGSGEYNQWESPTYEILNAATYNGSRLVWQGKSWASTYLKLSKNNGNISVINNSLYNVSIAAIKIIGTELKDCPNCDEEMDYENICHNTECENSPDYIARCSNCDSELDNEGICHNVDCELSPDYIEYCIECNSILVDHICHNNKCPNSPDYIEDEDPIVGGELSLTDDMSLTKVFRAPLVADEFNLVESLNILSLDE